MKLKQFFILMAIFLISQKLYAHGISHERIQEITHTIESDASNPELYVKRGRVHMDSEHWSEAIADFKKSAALQTNYYEPHYWLALSYFKQDNLELAGSALKMYLQHKTASPRGHRLMANIYTQQDNFESAEFHFKRALAEDAQPPPQIHIERLKALKDNPSITGEKLYTIFSNTIETYGKIVTTYNAYYAVFSARGDYTRALKVIETLPITVLEIPEWQINKIETLIKLQHYQSAQKQTEDLLVKIEKMPAHKKNTTAIINIKVQARNYFDQLQNIQTGHPP